MRTPVSQITLVLVVASVALLVRPAEAAVQTVLKRWDTTAAFERCTRDANVEVTDQGVGLKKSMLVQDEVGCTYFTNVEPLSETVWAKKLFVLDDPRCDGAELFTFSRGQRASCNGTPLPECRELPSTGWQIWDVPPELLREGVNEFVFSGGGSLHIENSLFPDRSAKSTDGGASWEFDRLGPSGVQNGEYVVRLRLAQYPPRGTITSEVFDLADWGEPIRPRVQIQNAQVVVEGDAEVLVRTGSTPSPDASWSAWTQEPRWQRFGQWQAVLKRHDATQSQTFTSVSVPATVERQGPAADERTSTIEILELTAPARQCRSQLFAYQPSGGRLDVLRNRHELDKVVSGAKTELERFVLLREWVRFTAPNGWDMGAAQWVPPWDALVILEMNNPARALCMCTHYSVIFTQCALALGYTAREVILDHHCAAEVWSNEYGKWILMDAGNWPIPELNCHYEHEGIPLNALEIRRLWKAGRETEIDVVYTPPRERVHYAEIEVKGAFNLANFRRFGIPFRNDHLVSPFPGELAHGVSHYYADVYLWWEDTAVPLESPEYSNTSCRPADFYWTLNEAAIDLEETDAPDTLHVTLDTVTPNFARFLVSVDGAEWEARPSSFMWKLHKGENTLRAKSVNCFGIEGRASVARLSVQ